MNNKVLIDIPEIQKFVKEKHNMFLKNYGTQIDKIVADHKLMIEVILARIYRIAMCFQEEKVIDTIDIVDAYPLKSMRLSKRGFDSYIIITTNGESVIIEGFGYILGVTSDIILPKIKIDNINKKEYDWTTFAQELLDYIHMVIYERQKACETKLNDLFKENN